MGNGVSFTAQEDSPTTPGQKSILTSEIEGVASDKLLDGIEKYVRDGKAVSGWQQSVEVTDKDGGILVRETYKGDAHIFNLYTVDRASSQVEIKSFPNQVLFDKGVAVATGFMKVLSEPVRVECWSVMSDVRLSGRFLKGMLETILTTLDAAVEVAFDTPSIDDSSKLSASSSPIEGKSVDADNFLDKFKEILIDKQSATELQDGSLVEERAANWLGMGEKTYSKHIISKDDNCVCIYEYGTDSTMTDLSSIVHIKVHKGPFRLEAWRQQQFARRAGDPQKAIFEPLVKGVLNAMSG